MKVREFIVRCIKEGLEDCDIFVVDKQGNEYWTTMEGVEVYHNFEAVDIRAGERVEQ